jgi:hypothetical protein
MKSIKILVLLLFFAVLAGNVIPVLASGSPESHLRSIQQQTTEELVPIFSDGFESGNLSAWSATNTGGGNLSVSTASAMVGSYGMQAFMGANRIYVVDQSPANEST